MKYRLELNPVPHRCKICGNKITFHYAKVDRFLFIYKLLLLVFAALYVLSVIGSFFQRELMWCAIGIVIVNVLLYIFIYFFGGFFIEWRSTHEP